MITAVRPPLENRWVLVVEDEYFVADDIARLLKKAGAEVLGPVPTRDEALGLLRSAERVDAAVLDINLRGEMVYPVADALRERGVPFIFATGYDESSVPPGYGEISCFEKPFRLEDLVGALAPLSKA